MSKREAISRYSLIINKLRKHPANFEAISDYLKKMSDLEGYNYIISKRTFQRDLEDIRSLYDIDITYDFPRKVYYIKQDGQQPEVKTRILEAFDTLNALKVADAFSGYMQFENRKPQGTDNLHGLLHAIKNRLTIKFTYTKYWENKITHRIANPLMLKEFKTRWYVLAKDHKDSKIKTFALDRLTELEITKANFQIPDGFNADTFFKHCFGIISPDNKEPQNIVLSFDSYQGKFIKSLPLHNSQNILVDTEKELRIALKLYLTHDFIMELLSHGDKVKVISPTNLTDELKKVYKNSLNRYE
jgi:predicted DNA-binding transcriptional regulator YafY